MEQGNGDMTAAIALNHVGKRFGDKVAVEDLCLEVPPGCIYGFLGPNGAGKTTTLRMIVGIFYPDQGSVRVLGQSNPAAVRERIGYLPEERGLYDRMRLVDQMTYYGRLKGMGARQAGEVSSRLLVEYGLGDWQEKKCNTLSKGMAQKVQILATIMHGPDLVILDEPFSGLDPVNRDVMRDLILQLKRDGKSVLFSTHIMEQAEQICDFVVLIDRGAKVLDGSLSSVRAAAGQSIRLDYDGNGSSLAQIPGVERVNDSGKQAELFLSEGGNSQKVLEALIAHGIRVRRFDLTELSLHEIFLRAVGGEGAAA